MRCAECGAPVTEVTSACAECGAPPVGKRSAVAGAGDGRELVPAAAVDAAGPTAWAGRGRQYFGNDGISDACPDADASEAQPPRRRRRIVLITGVAASVLAAAVITAVAVANSSAPRPVSSVPRPVSSAPQPVSSVPPPARPVATFAYPGGSGVNAVAFSPDGKTLAAGD